MKDDIDMHLDKVDHLMTPLMYELKMECQRLIKSGAIDITQYSPEEFALAKTLLTAALRRTTEMYAPPKWNKPACRAIKNLEKV